MENENTQDIIKARYKQLPSEIQQAITATDLPTKLNQLAKKYSLRIDQAGDLQVEILLIMLGLESSDDFIDNVSKNLELNKEVSKSIAVDVNSQILGNIRTSLMKIQEKEEKEEGITTEKTNTPDKESVLHAIENPTSSRVSTSINLLAEEYPLVIPGQKSEPTKSASSGVYPPMPTSRPVAQPPKNLAEYYMISNPTPAKSENPVTPAAPTPPTPPNGPSPILGKNRVPGAPDPYREPIE